MENNKKQKRIRHKTVEINETKNWFSENKIEKTLAILIVGKKENTNY